MKMLLSIRSVLALSLVACAAMACPQAANPSDAGDGCAEMCATLARPDIACPEGMPDKDCLGTCKNAMKGRNAADPPLFPACIAKAKTREEVRACKSVNCVFSERKQ